MNTRMWRNLPGFLIVSGGGPVRSCHRISGWITDDAHERIARRVDAKELTKTDGELVDGVFDRGGVRITPRSEYES